MNKEELEEAIRIAEEDVARSEDCLTRVHGANRWYGSYVESIRVKKLALAKLREQLDEMQQIS